MAVYMNACVLSCFSCVCLFTTLLGGTVALQDLLSMGFSRQEY